MHAVQAEGLQGDAFTNMFTMMQSLLAIGNAHQPQEPFSWNQINDTFGWTTERHTPVKLL